MKIKKECRLCNSPNREIIDLGNSPPANNFISKTQTTVESFPLIVDFCDQCGGFQLRHCLEKEQLYSHYTYLTPDTVSLNDHYENIVNYLTDNKYITKEMDCLEIGSNNGRFLKFLEPYVKSVLGVDPAENVASIAKSLGIETIVDFFSKDVIHKIKNKDRKIQLIVARHMFAHNPNPNEIFEGINSLLDEKGVILIENQYVFDTLQTGAFDQIYHEHMFYYSVKNMQNYLNSHAYDLNDIFFSDIHGGSIVFIGSRRNQYPVSKNVKDQITWENKLLDNDKILNKFRNRVGDIKTMALKEINKDIREGKRVCAYGAPAKAFTMFSLLDLDNSKINFCVDTSATKIGKYFPIFNIPVVSEDQMTSMEYDTFLVTAWNYKTDILSRSSKLFKANTKLIFPLPDFEILYT